MVINRIQPIALKGRNFLPLALHHYVVRNQKRAPL